MFKNLGRTLTFRAITSLACNPPIRHADGLRRLSDILMMWLMHVVGPSSMDRDGWDDFLTYKGPENFPKNLVSLCGSAEP